MNRYELVTGAIATVVSTKSSAVCYAVCYAVTAVSIISILVHN